MATADTKAPTPVSGEALPTVQVDGVVWAQTVIGHTVFAGGSFAQTQVAGARPSWPKTPRANLLAYNVDTGELIADFAPQVNGQVLGLASSPDGTRLYVVGDFTSINGVTRSRIAALDPNSGAVLPGFAPVLNTTAMAVTAVGSRVFVGGGFTAASGTTRSRAAAFDQSGNLLPWAPQPAGGVVRAVVLSPDSSKALIGGSFTSTNGQSAPGRGMAAVDSTSGRSLPWAAGKVIHNGGVVDDPIAPSTASSSIYSLSTLGNIVYATGQATGTTWQDANLEGMVAMRWADGSIQWLEDCHGDTYSSVPFDDAVYVASHSHNCSTLGGFGEMSPDAHRAIGFSQSPTQTLQHNTQQGPGSYQDFAGMPAPSLVDFYPTFLVGTYTGAYQAAWSVTQGAGYLLYGGEFQQVNGERQTGLVRFKGYPDTSTGVVEAPTPTPTPTSTPTTAPSPSPSPAPGSRPSRVSTPDAIALGPTKAAVRWSAPKGAVADKVSGYVVTAYKGSKAVQRTTVGKNARVATLSHLAKSTTYKIGVAAKNSHGTGASSLRDSVKTKASGANVSATKKPGKVAKPSVTTRVAGIRVRWRGASVSGALPVATYQVRIALHGKTVRTAQVDDRLRAKLVSGLKHHASYTVSVRARNWVGWGAWSLAKGARTK
ncbi:fibronectin type III domain-containing protein [Amnibacterium soli]|uniref:fibronectin type III domain-containing protein n=1 Tax=Amnibacterium soli TaxID=1282736 RepID=UPI0031EAC9AF